MKQAVSLLFLIPFCNGIIQEVTFHESDTNYLNNSYTYRENVLDVSRYPFQNITRSSSNTNFPAFRSANYGSFYILLSARCYTMSSMKSFRFFGNRDTAVDAISMFSGTNYGGVETYVNHSPFVLHTPMKSLGYTGKSNWTVFENDNFDGKSACLHAGTGIVPKFYPDLKTFNITNIGSLFKGCGVVTAEIIEAMRRKIRARA